jgi:leader peptidase (prepilin peptidase)/N-methyltransferase
LFPVLSYIAQKGKCRHCLGRIKPRYPAVEIITGIIFYICALHAPAEAGRITESFNTNLSGEVVFLKNIIFLSALLVIFFIDIDHQIIPDVISIPLVPIGLAFAFAVGRNAMLYDSLKAAAAGFAGFYLIAVIGQILFKREAMGGGDIKLAAALGAFLGMEQMLVGLFLAFVLGVAVGVPFTLARGRSLRNPIPFGPMMALGAAIALFKTTAIVTWWYGHLDRIWS